MNIAIGTPVAVVVTRAWANLKAVGVFLLANEQTQGTTSGPDDGLILFAKVLDADAPHGLWIELHADRHREDPNVQLFRLLVAWNVILTLVIAEEFPPYIREQAKRIGFVTD
jgi:hypothetical protein